MQDVLSCEKISPKCLKHLCLIFSQLWSSLLSLHLILPLLLLVNCSWICVNTPSCFSTDPLRYCYIEDKKSGLKSVTLYSSTQVDQELKPLQNNSWTYFYRCILYYSLKSFLCASGRLYVCICVPYIVLRYVCIYIYKFKYIFLNMWILHMEAVTHSLLEFCIALFAMYMNSM